MENETRNCQNCKQDFVVEKEDFNFYKKMKVPAPTFCPQCRFQRRLMFRNERTFYKRKCAMCEKSIITLFSEDKPQTVYCQPCWWSDKWDASEYAMDYDPSRNFFEQFKKLQEKVPHMSLITSYSTLVNSEYSNHVGYQKNTYLLFNSDYAENCLYGTIVNNMKDSMDMLMVGESELCYENLNCGKCYNLKFSEECSDCRDVSFSKNCVGCSNCFACVNLRKQQYHIFNEAYSKEEYEKKIAEYNLGSYIEVQKLKKEAEEFWKKFPKKFMHGTHNVNVTGDYVYESKNAKDMYMTRFVEDGRFCQWITLAPAKDIYDQTEWGNGVQRTCDVITVGEGADNVKYCFGVWKENSNNEYSTFNISCHNTFGCVGLRKKKNAILNKEYSEEEFHKLREKIIADLEKNPYVDSKGRIFKYGEFFPYDLSLFNYNESSADQYFKLNKNEVEEKGWRWKEPESSKHKATMSGDQIPDDIADVDESILKEVVGCEDCSRPFIITPAELKLLKRFHVPLPRKCPDCRHMDRLSRLNPPKLWDRTCDKCSVELKSSYDPTKGDKVLCEACYQAEVI